MMFEDRIVVMLEARIAVLERQLAALMQRRGSLFALARSTLAVNDAGPVQTVQAQLDALSVRDAIPLLYSYGVTGSPPVAADLHVAFLDGDRSKAVAIASGHQSYRLRGLSPGDSALYDSRGAPLWLTPGGPAVNCGGNPMVITGDLHVTGAVIAGYGGGDQAGLQTHQHGTGAAAAGTVAPTAGT
jgi:phage gp45-like